MYSGANEEQKYQEQLLQKEDGQITLNIQTIGRSADKIHEDVDASQEPETYANKNSTMGLEIAVVALIAGIMVVILFWLIRYRVLFS